VGTTRRNPGRMDGVTWQGSTFICSRRIDGPTPDFDDKGYDAEYNDRSRTPDFRVSPSRRGVPMIHSLLDIALPAKQRGMYCSAHIIACG
jgi:hypothetical protein